MKLTLKRSLVAVIAIVALLAAQAGGLMSRHAAPVHMTATQHAQQLAWYCPAPPVTC